MNKIAVLAALGLVAMSTAAGAYDGRGSDIDRRQSIQEQRIQQGVRSGEITREEYRRLENEQARIRELERQAKRDGRIDHREAARIREAQNEASRHLRQEATDNDRRGHGHGGRRWW